MKILFFLLAILTTQAFAQDGCALNFKEFHSGLTQKSKNFKSMKPEIRNEKKMILSQEAILTSGEKVVFSGGGCAHASYKFTYSNFILKDDSAKTAFTTAISLLNKTDGNSNYTKVLLDSLEKAHKDGLKAFAPNNYPLPCGDAECVLEIKGKDKKREMEISYSFAL